MKTNRAPQEKAMWNEVSNQSIISAVKEGTKVARPIELQGRRSVVITLLGSEENTTITMHLNDEEFRVIERMKSNVNRNAPQYGVTMEVKDNTVMRSTE